MIYLLLYLLIGMIYAGKTFGKSLKFSLEHGFTEDEKELIKQNKETDEIKGKMVAALGIVILLSLVKIPLYPMMWFMRIGKKSKPVGE